MNDRDLNSENNLLKKKNKRLKVIIGILITAGVIVVIGGVMYLNKSAEFSRGVSKGAKLGAAAGRDAVIETLIKCDQTSDLLKFLRSMGIVVSRLGMPKKGG